ncbi:MAG: phosphate acyltransferase PlsX [Phycisphaerae bacterium]|nr:phosphate acyltransferase PlsX [Phycisphaerae bacterium]
MRIAVDAMGGDKAPDEIVAGVLASLEQLDDNHIVLIGDEPRILELLGDPSVWKEKVSVVHASEVIEMDDSPVEALKKKRKSSISIMSKMAKEGSVDIVLSAGNTGACVAACQMRMRLLPGVQKPGILVVFPTIAGPIVICDVGANVAPKHIHLHQYALMASVYAREVLGVTHPTVGLLSIGQEDSKGNELVKKTNRLMREDDRIDFIGNVEPRSILQRPSDVLICEGFVGNIILKLTEGLAEGIFRFIGKEFARQKPELLPHFKPVVESIYAKHDYNEYGGAPLLGVNGTCVICHGSSDARAIKNAILIALRQAKTDINSKIVEQLAKTSDALKD